MVPPNFRGPLDEFGFRLKMILHLPPQHARRAAWGGADKYGREGSCDCHPKSDIRGEGEPPSHIT